MVLHRLEPPSHILDGELLEVEECLDRHDDLCVLPRHVAEEFLHRALLREVGVAVACHLLHQIGKTKGKVLDLLTRLKVEAFPLPSEALQRRPAHMISTDACCVDRFPFQLCRSLVGEGGAELGGDGGAQHLQRPTIVVVVDAADVNRLPQPPGLQLDLHQQAPVVVDRL